MTILTKSCEKKPTTAKLLILPTSDSANYYHDDEEARLIVVRNNRNKLRFVAILFLIATLLAAVGCFFGADRSEITERSFTIPLDCYIPYDFNEVNAREMQIMNSRLMRPIIENNNSEDSSDKLNYASLMAYMQRITDQLTDDLENNDDNVDNSEYEDIGVKNRFFYEKFKFTETDNETSSEIEVPDFRDGRSGRYIHDYVRNQTGIIDNIGKRCFIYRLDYNTTIPPKDFMDLMVKMREGYYIPKNMRKNMRVVLPDIPADSDEISPLVVRSCINMKIYKLEPFVRGVFKRSVTNTHAKFAEMAGKNVVEYDLINYDDVLKYENSII